MTDYFVVHGSTGEYSDRYEWSVAVVPTEEDARRYVAALQAQYQLIAPSMFQCRWDDEDKMKAIMSLDPGFSCDYTGTRYFYGCVQFLSGAALDEKLAAAVTENDA